MKTVNKLLVVCSTTILTLGLVPCANSALAPASVAGKALVIEIQTGTGPFEPDNGFAVLPAVSGNAFALIGVESAPNASGTYTYSTSGSADSSMALNLGSLGQYQLSLHFTSDHEGTFYLTATDGSGSFAMGNLLYLAVPVPTSLQGVELRLTPDPNTFQSGSTARVVPSSSGTSYTMYGGAGNVEEQGTYVYSRPNPCLGKLIIHDSVGGTRTAYFGLFQPSTGKFGVEGMGASQIVSLSLADHVVPQVTITSPAAGARMLQLPVQVQGTATDNTGVASVTYTIQNANGTSPVLTATGASSWTATIPDPAPGTNIITVIATDTDGNQSAPVSRAFFYVASSQLTVQSSGNGSFTPNLNGQFLEIGRTYSITATPGSGYLFGTWQNGGATVTTPTLSFTMSSNLVLQATFITNRFPAVAGSYNGMFPSLGQWSVAGSFQSLASRQSDTTAPVANTLTTASAQNVGSVSLTVTPKGSYTGKIVMSGATYSLSGQFNAYGFATKSLPRKNATPLVLNLELGFNGEDMVVGNVGDGQTWTNTLSASRCVFTTKAPAPLANNNYTFIIPTPTETGTPSGPTGYSFGTLKISPTGLVNISGTLADGTPITQNTTLSKDGDLALCISLYRGAGLLAGWLHCDTNAVQGDVQWNAPTNRALACFANGLEYRASLISSLYLPKAASILNVTNAEVQFTGGNLVLPFTNHIQIAAGPKVMNLATNRLTLTFTKPSGLFTGSVTAPGSKRATPFKGVVLQSFNSGAGYFLGTNDVGAVLIKSLSP